MIDWLAILDRLEKLNPKVQALILLLLIGLNVYWYNNNSKLKTENDNFEIIKQEALKKSQNDCYEQIKTNRENDQKLVDEYRKNNNKEMDSVYAAFNSKIRKYDNKIAVLENSLNKN
jgi:NhaP-type Na+/H+ and K+/H+ antiporter